MISSPKKMEDQGTFQRAKETPGGLSINPTSSANNILDNIIVMKAPHGIELLT